MRQQFPTIISLIGYQFVKWRRLFRLLMIGGGAGRHCDKVRSVSSLLIIPKPRLDVFPAVEILGDHPVHDLLRWRPVGARGFAAAPRGVHFCPPFPLSSP